MATVHPSRLGLVPQAKPSPPPSREEELKRKLLERRQARETSHGRDGRSEDRQDTRLRAEVEEDRIRAYGTSGDRRDREGRTEGGDQRRHLGEEERNGNPGERSYRDDRYDGHRTDRRSREREERLPETDRSRRASPSYRPYATPAHREEPNGSGQGRPPWMAAKGGMPPFPPRGAMPPFPPRGGYVPMDLERRRVERDNMILTVWPPSPERPYKDDDELAEERAAARKARKKSRKSKRKSKYSESDSSSTDTDEERLRRQRRKEKDRERRKRYTTDDSEEERQRKKRKSRDRSERERSRSERQRSERSAKPEADAADQWVEKDGEVVLVPSASDTATLVFPAADEDDDEIGPQLPVEHGGRGKHREKFKDMLYGEAEAMARFAANGQRIPRRGEIGLDSEQIEAFETSGYVMSGSRHQRMNAVRLRKENQVINAEEKRAILKLQREEQEKKEGAIVSQFRELLDERLKASENTK